LFLKILDLYENYRVQVSITALALRESNTAYREQHNQNNDLNKSRELQKYRVFTYEDKADYSCDHFVAAALLLTFDGTGGGQVAR